MPEPASAAPVSVRKCGPLAVLHLSLRAGAAPAPKAAAGAVGAVFGLELPKTPGLSAEQGPRTAVPLAPGRWLLTASDAADGEKADVLAATLAAAAGADGAVNNLSSGYAVFRVAGPRSRDVLAKSCPVDLHPRAFGPGACASTVMAHAAVTLRRAGGGDDFDLFAARSFARHFEEWLAHAAAEYTAPV